MLNSVYRLVSPGVILPRYIDSGKGGVVVRPDYMAICHADQRYYLGQRESGVLRRKLPMALIHECCGHVVRDDTGTYSTGQNVVLIPNVPGQDDPIIFENYSRGSRFLSSGEDGFMRETVELPPDRLVPFQNIPLPVAAITEFVSVAVHAVHRFSLLAHSRRERIGIWGDGSLAYVVASVLKKRFPQMHITVVGLNSLKLSHFSFVDRRLREDDLPADFQIDHAFECCGGEGSAHAIEDIIRCIHPQGMVTLMGVSESPIPVKTRDVLEKGLTLTGCSRSGREDFEQAVAFMEDPLFSRRLQFILFEDDPVRSIPDIHRVFATDLNTPFKTVFRWML